MALLYVEAMGRTTPTSVFQNVPGILVVAKESAHVKKRAVVPDFWVLYAVKTGRPIGTAVLQGVREQPLNAGESVHVALDIAPRFGVLYAE